MKFFIGTKKTFNELTDFLIEKSAETNSVIVVNDFKIIEKLKKIAKEKELDIPEPITIREFIISRFFYNNWDNANKKSNKYLFFEAGSILDTLSVDIATFTIEEDD